DAQRWLVDTTSGLFSADVLVGAVGALCEPALPDIKGIENFQGELFHSARWNHEADLKGKRVALIGTGASAIQIGPAIADEVDHLDVYQRTAPWVMPRHDRAYSKVESLAYQHVPFLQRAAREAIVVATGFHVTDSPTYQRIIGKDGRSLASVWDEQGQQAYKGAAVAGFPNLLFVVGPNTGLGHSSMVYMIESHLNYLSSALKTVEDQPLATF